MWHFGCSLQLIARACAAAHWLPRPRVRRLTNWPCCCSESLPRLQVAALEHVAGVRVGLAAAGPLSWTCADSQLLVQACVLSGHLLGGLLDADFLPPLEEALGTTKPEVGAQRLMLRCEGGLRRAETG